MLPRTRSSAEKMAVCAEAAGAARATARAVNRRARERRAGAIAGRTQESPYRLCRFLNNSTDGSGGRLRGAVVDEAPVGRRLVAVERGEVHREALLRNDAGQRRRIGGRRERLREEPRV